MTSSDIADFVRPVEGWLFDGEARLLFELARTANPNGVIVEIGSWKGKSTICMAKGAGAGSKCQIVAIDPHIGSEEHQSETQRVWTFQQFQANIEKAGVTGQITPLVKFSTDAAKDFSQPVSLLFIDGAHDYDSVKADFEAWYPKVISGGVIAFHDTTGWEGPRRFVRTALFRNPQIQGANFSWSISYGVKSAKVTSWHLFLNRFRLCLKEIYTVGLNLATQPWLKKTLGRVSGNSH